MATIDTQTESILESKMTWTGEPNYQRFEFLRKINEICKYCSINFILKFLGCFWFDFSSQPSSILRKLNSN
jgi:hypothetical protein